MKEHLKQDFFIILANFLTHAVPSATDRNLALGRPAVYSNSIQDLNANPSHAVDGNNDTNYNHGSCALSFDSAGGPNWWRVDLGQQFYVRMVAVTNRGDCCAYGLDYFIVGVTNSTDDPVRGNYPLCSQYSSTAALGARITLQCNPLTAPGQFVIVQQPSNGLGWLTICEFEVYGDSAGELVVRTDPNIALGRPTKMSGINYNPSRAVDGNTNSNYYNGSCAQMGDAAGGPNWWKVDLGQPYYVRMVVVTNRGDCCGDSLNYFYVGVTNSTAKPVRGNYPLCNQYQWVAQSGARITLPCLPNTDPGQFVIVQQPSNGPGYMTLCEVEVYEGIVTEGAESFDQNLALGRSASMTGSWYNPNRAVDGNSDPDYSHGSCAQVSDGNWWRVQLDRPYRVRMVIVTNRGDCCANGLDYFIVGITNSPAEPVRGNYPLCNQYKSTAALGARITLQCNPLTDPGQFVIIQQPSDGSGSFSLCEFEVYGFDVTDASVATDQNLALGRPAMYSSSILDLNKNPSHAVDGNNDTYYSRGSCATSYDAAGGPNWWRVNLGRRFRINMVAVISPGDCCAGSLDYFFVGITNSPVEPVRGNYPLCNQYDSTAALGARITLQCNPLTDPGQFVIIQQPSNGPGLLTVCEVEVYAAVTATTTITDTTVMPTSSAIASSTATEWKRYSGQRLIAPGVVSMKKQFALHCVDECRRTTACDSINWQPASNICELNVAVGGVVPSVSTSYPDWFWWRPVV